VTDSGTILIDGVWQQGDDVLAIGNPSDGSTVGHVAWGSEKDAVRAADAAAVRYLAMGG
jgi:succinate-semialdehyde dehydrogenase/glutarate-semialdehyde dehydrogenase